MSDQPTPETDAEWDRLQMLPVGGYNSQAAGVKLAFGMARWASTLERQRDEAWEQLNCICRDGFRYQDTISLEPCANYVLRKLKEERELARELRDALERLANAGHTDDCLLLNFANGHCDCGVNEACLLIAKTKEVLP